MKYVEIPYEELDAETLKAVVHSFVLREGTNYGAQEFSEETKIEQVLRQIQKGKVKIVFDSETESCTLLTDHQLRDFILEAAKLPPPSETH